MYKQEAMRSWWCSSFMQSMLLSQVSPTASLLGQLFRLRLRSTVNLYRLAPSIRKSLIATSMFARLVAATCGFARVVSYSADASPPSTVAAAAAADDNDHDPMDNNTHDSENNNSISSEDEDGDCCELREDDDDASDNNNNNGSSNNNKMTSEPLRVLGVGWANKCAHALSIPAAA